MPGKLSVHVVSDVDDDVLAGLELYRSMAHPDLGPEVVRDWLYWFEENPFGRPSIALASLDGEIVGMHSLIPSRSSLGGKIVPSAKGEFFVVRPDCSSLMESQSGLRLALALPKLAREHAAANGVRFTFGVPARTALLSGQVTGARLISWETLAFVAPARFSGLEGGGITRAAGVAGMLALGRLKRSVRRLWRSVVAAGFEVEAAKEFTKVSPSARIAANHLFAHDPDLLNFRFPDPHYCKYRLVQRGEEVAQFVFTAPKKKKGSIMSLKFWSSIPALDQGLASLLVRVIRDAGSGGAELVRLEIPKSNPETGRELKQMGFMQRKNKSHVALTWCATESLTKTRDEESWDSTNAHSGWYQLN